MLIKSGLYKKAMLLTRQKYLKIARLNNSLAIGRSNFKIRRTDGK
jgi:hypothetical protein